MDYIRKNTLTYDKTLDLNAVVGANVLSSNGAVVGKVSRIRLDRNKLKLEGIVVKRSVFQKRMYVDRTYFKKLSPDAIILNMEPSVLLRGRKVITFEGKVVGRVRKVNRVHKTNEIESVEVKPLLRKPITIPVDAIKYQGKSIILEEGYDVPQTGFR